jgi:trimethylamine--corrinoid protein Co-methyltransferase
MGFDPFLLRVVGKDTLQSIHDQSLLLLNGVGVVFDSEAIIRCFVENGQRVDGKRVYLSETFVIEALESTPEDFVMHARNGHADVRIGGHHNEMVVAPGNGWKGLSR